MRVEKSGQILEVFRVPIKEWTDLATEEVWRDEGDGGQDFRLGYQVHGGTVY